MTSDTTNAIRNRKNNSFAMPAAVPARPPKPKMAARMAMMKNPIAQLSIEPPDSWMDPVSGAIAVPQSDEGGLALRLGDGLYHHQRGLLPQRQIVVRFIFGQRDGRLAEGGDQPKDAQVILRHRLQRAEPVQELGEMGDALGMRAAGGRGRIERAAALRARHAVGNQGKSAGNDGSIHVFFSSDETQRERSRRARAWIAQIPSTARNGMATSCRPKASGAT